MLEHRTYSVTEAAKILGISRTTAYEAVRRGDIASITIGKRIFVTRRALQRLLEPTPHRDQPATSNDATACANARSVSAIRPV